MSENLKEEIKKLLQSQPPILPNEEITKIVFNVLKLNQGLDKNQIITIIQNNLYQKSQEYLAKPQNLVLVLNQYINQNLKECEYPLALKELQKLITFIEKLDVPFPLTVANGLITNKTLESLISQVMQKNIELNSEIWNTLLISYCGVNDEEIATSQFDLNGINYYLKEISKIPILSIEEEQELGKEIQNGNKEAEAKLVKHNLRFVVYIAKKYLHLGLELEDLISFGNLGLMKSATMFDWQKGYKFSTYAGYWINRYIKIGLNETANNIRIPEDLNDLKNHYLHVKNQFELENGRKPSLEEMIEKTGYSKKIILKLDALATTISFNSKIKEEDETELVDLLIMKENLPEDLMIKNSLSAKIHELLYNTNLNEMERNVLLYRYGFYDGQVWTLESIAKKFAKTKERIRQVESRALKKLRMNPQTKNLLIFAQNPTKSEINLQNYIEYYGQTKSSHKKEYSKNTSLYDLLKISPQELPKILEKLFPEEKELVIKRYGADFCTFNTVSWTKEDSFNFNSYVRKVLFTIKNNPYYERNHIPMWITQKRQKSLQLKK